MLTSLLVVAAVVWVPLFPALAWGRCPIPREEVLLRSAKFTIAVGLPLSFVGFVLFLRMNPYESPHLVELLATSGVRATAFLPFYGALVTTGVFSIRHRAGIAKGEARSPVVRFVSGAVIFVATSLATLLMIWSLGAAAGAYRGWG